MLNHQQGTATAIGGVVAMAGQPEDNPPDQPERQNNERGAFTVDEFCDWARIGRTIFYREVNEGRLRLRKIGGRIGGRSIVTYADAMAWLDGLPEKEAA